MENTRYKDIYTHLEGEGFEVYSPGQKQGECMRPYVVVRMGTVLQFDNYSTDQALYEILCYVPKEKYTELEIFVRSVKNAMFKLRPMIMPVYSDTAPFYDDTVKAYMVSISYRNMRKINY